MRAAMAVFLATLLIAGGVAAGALLMIYRYPDTAPATPTRDVEIDVPLGAAFPRVLETLRDHGLVVSPLYFRVYATWRGLATKIKAGHYRMRTDMTPRQVLDRLVRGGPEPDVLVTIPEGKNLLEVAVLLAQAGVAAEADLARRARDPSFARELGVPAATLEGYLFPDTYRLHAGHGPDEALRTLRKRQEEVLARVKADHADGLRPLKAMGWGDHEVVVLASIVEKETGAQEERPLVASVYLNRLRRPGLPHLLEADPTITYGCTVPLGISVACRSFTGRIRRIHLRDRDNPYNTYVHPGLPPGPIANPGRAALEAVLAPAESDYLYFVSRNDGTHQFSATLAEHQAAVDRYQRGATP
jgi:peptidoglycan lytic transglycosylase G